MSSFLRDIRFAGRTLLRQRGFATIAILTLALGIGANTAIFSLLNPLLFRPLRVPDADRVCRVFSGRSGANVYQRVSYPNYLDLRDHTRSFASLAASSWPTPFTVGLETERGGAVRSEIVWGAVVSGNYFTTLGVPAALGRAFSLEEDRVPDAHAVVVVSHRLWETKLAANPQAVGQTLRLNGRAFTVIGVAPRDMAQTEFMFPLDLWVPMMMQAQAMPGQAHKLASRKETWLSVIGRLRPGVTLTEARAELETTARRLEQTYPGDNPHLALPVMTEQESRTRLLPGVAKMGWALLGILALVLLIACANIASLLFARSLARRREFAVRTSLGASRSRLVRQLLTESLLISLFGGTCGLGVASVATRGLLALTPPVPIEISVDARIDIRVLMFTLAVSLGTGVLLGILPALRTARWDLASALKGDDAAIGSPRGRAVARDVLVTGQVAVCLVLLITAGLCIRSFQEAQRIDLGFDPENRLLATVDPGQAGYSKEQAARFQSRLLAETRMLPGVLAASFTAHPQLAPGYLGDGHVYPEGESPLSDDRRPVVYYDSVGPRYFDVMGITLRSGRDFADEDRAGTARVGIVNQTFARAFWPGQSPIGKRLRLNDPAGAWIEIIGVAPDGKYQSLGEPPQRHLYLPSLQNHHSATTLILHTSGDPRGYAQTVRSLVQRLDPDLPVTEVRSMNEHLGFALYPARTSALLFAVCGALGLMLAMLGVYGLLAFTVRQRTREIGIRIALGAGSQDILWMVTRKSAALLAWGLAVGLVAAYATSGVMSGFLYGINARDALTFGAATAFLLLAAAIATALPARHASRVDPMVALRFD
jgi:predicted permease